VLSEFGDVPSYRGAFMVTGSDCGRTNISSQVSVRVVYVDGSSLEAAPLSPESSVPRVSTVKPPRKRAFLSRSVPGQTSLVDCSCFVAGRVGSDYVPYSRTAWSCRQELAMSKYQRA